MNIEETIITIPVIHLFLGYYRIPKNTSIILDSISVAHLIDSRYDCKCDFEIKKEDGEYIIVPDVSKIDLRHSMKFIIKYKEKYSEKECAEWHRKIRELKEQNKLLHTKLCECCNENEKLEMENECLQQQNETLMKLKDMSVEDVKILIRSKESVNRLSDLCDTFHGWMF